MFSTGVGLEKDEKSFPMYPSGEQYEQYRENFGLSYDYVNYLAESIPEYLHTEVPQEALPFEVNYLNFTKNREGALILASKEFNPIDLTDAQYALLNTLSGQYQLQPLARYNFDHYKSILQDIVTEQTEDALIAQERLIIFEIVERTLSFAFGDVVHYDHEMPSFDVTTLETHEALTEKILEYDFYYQSEEIPEAFYAYRYAHEKMIEIYGLLNYLQQQHQFALDEQTLDTIRSEQEQLLNERLKDAHFKTYFDELLAKFAISKADYVEAYLMVLAAHEQRLQQMQDKKIGIDVDGRYNKGAVHTSYRRAAQLSWEQQFEMMEKLQKPSIEALDPQPELSVILPYDLEVGINEQGQFVFTTYIGYLPMWLSEKEQAYIEALQKEDHLPALSRYAVPLYVKSLAKRTNDEFAQSLLELFTIYEATID